MTDAAAVEKTVAAANAAHGQATDVVICSAGLAKPGYFLDTPMEVHRQEMELNYFGTLNTIKACTPAMIAAANKGRILLVRCVFCWIFFFWGGERLREYCSYPLPLLSKLGCSVCAVDWLQHICSQQVCADGSC